MILLATICWILILGIVLYFSCRKYKFQPPPTEINPNVPKIVHLIYIPWDRKQKLKKDYMDFDQSFYRRFSKENPDYEVKMWTLPDIQNFLQQEYPQYYDIIFNLPRPTMIVDFLRLLIVYHYGGIYWQYASENNTYTLDSFLPSRNKDVKLFTENILSESYCKKIAHQPIRNGIPEEPLRICNQIYSSVPKNNFIKSLFDRAIENSQKYTVKRDYDILYIGANAMISTVFNEIGKTNPSIELVDLATTYKMITISSKGSWRMD